MPGASSSATHTPPISEASTSKLTSMVSAKGTTRAGKPKRLRMASVMVCSLAMAKRPDISTRKMTHTVPSASAQRSEEPKAAPACDEVAIEPASRKPPMLVTMPSAMPRKRFIARGSSCRELAHQLPHRLAVAALERLAKLIDRRPGLGQRALGELVRRLLQRAARITPGHLAALPGARDGHRGQAPGARATPVRLRRAAAADGQRGERKRACAQRRIHRPAAQQGGCPHAMSRHSPCLSCAHLMRGGGFMAGKSVKNKRK